MSKETYPGEKLHLSESPKILRTGGTHLRKKQTNKKNLETVIPMRIGLILTHWEQ
jgi:hypothetical protein